MKTLKLAGVLSLFFVSGFVSEYAEAQTVASLPTQAAPVPTATPTAGAFCTTYHSNVTNREIDYCVDRTTPDQPIQAGEPVTYFMHGLGGNSRSWFKSDYSASLAKLRESGQTLPPMTFISFATDPHSFFSDYPGNPDFAWETMFVTELIPYMEKTYGVCNQRQCRAIIGESMGGFGALKTSFQHLDMFSSIAVNSPALPPFSVRAPIGEWLKYFCLHKIGPAMGFGIIEIVRHIFLSDDSWSANDPIQLAANVPLDQFPALYFDMGGKDTFGFNVGYGIFKAELDQRAIPYSTVFEPEASHDMWKRHGCDAISFVLAHSTGAITPPVNDIAPVATTPAPVAAPVVASN